jgi:type I restriction enzyme S subunit
VNNLSDITLGTACEFVLDGTHGSPTRTETGVPVLSATNVQDGGLIYETERYTSVDEYNSFRRRLDLRSGDVLLTIVGSIGRAAVVLNPKPAVFQRSVAVLRPCERKTHCRYLYHLTQTPEFQAELVRRSNQSAQAGIYLGKLKEIPVRLPNWDEQRRIAAILDKTDTIRRNHAHAVGLADEFIRSVFLDIFGDPQTNPKDLPLAPIKSLGQVVTGNTPPRSNPIFYGKGIEWIKSDNIGTPDHIASRATEELTSEGRSVARVAPQGSTLVTCIAGSPSSIGNAALTDREVAFNQQINAVIPSLETDPYFLYCQFLVGKPLVQRASTNSMKGMVTKSKFERLMFLRPPLSNQRDFGRIVTQFLSHRQHARMALKESSDLFASLSQRAFKGQL